MICLLRNLIPIDIMDRLPSATDTSLRADLSRIKYYRNKIVHCNNALVDDTDFKSALKHKVTLYDREYLVFSDQSHVYVDKLSFYAI